MNIELKEQLEHIGRNQVSTTDGFTAFVCDQGIAKKEFAILSAIFYMHEDCEYEITHRTEKVCKHTGDVDVLIVTNISFEEFKQTQTV